MITIREDFLGKLELFSKRYPQNFDNYIRLGHLDTLQGDFASIGRAHGGLLQSDRPSAKGDIANAPLHLKKLVAIDVRSLNGTTINAEFLPYGSFRKLEERDIITLAGIAPFQFSQTRIADTPSPSRLGILIDGKSKTAHYLSENRHVVSLNGRDKITIGTTEKPDSFLTMADKEGQITIRAKENNHDLWTTMRLGDYTYVRCKIPPERDFAYFDFEDLYRDQSCEILTGRKDLNDVTRIEHDLFSVTYTYGDASFQIVPIISGLEASTATR